LAQKTFPDDQALIQGCIEGKKRSWDLFVEHYSRLIYSSIHKALQKSVFSERSDLVEEVFQEVFGRILERELLKSVRDAKSVPKFLMVMACRMTVDKIRALSSAEEKILTPEDPLMEVEASGDPAASAIDEEKKSIIGAVLDRLAPRDRACVEFYCMDGKTHLEISEILGMSQDTVSTIIRRTKEKLKQSFIRKGLKDF